MSSNEQLYIALPTHSIFSDVFTQPTAAAQPATYITSFNSPGQNVTNTYNIQIGEDQEVTAEDEDFAPNPNGELIGGCQKCGVVYGSSTELKLHFGAVHSRQTFECCVCNKLFLRRHGFLVHIKKYHEDVTSKSYPCPFCEHIYTNQESLSEHCEQNHKIPVTVCPLCQSTIDEGGMKEHIESQHTITTIENENLGNSTGSFQKNPGIPRKNSGVKITHKCDYDFCEYETTRVFQLQVHVKGKHQNERPFSCPNCEKTFKQKDKVERHIKSVHLQTKSFICDCGKSFNRKDDMVRHNNVVHLGEKYRYTRKEENKVLSYSTLNGSIIECAHCSYACDRSDRMKKHFLTVHQNERPFSCDKCDKTFKVKDKRDLHVNTVHLKKKPHACRYCQQAFGRKDSLKRHEEKWCTSNNLKPFTI